MITKVTLFLLLTALMPVFGQDLKSNFSEIALPLIGEWKYFGMRDLRFFSNPKQIPQSLIKQLDPNGDHEYVDSVFNMEDGALVSVKRRKFKYFGFFKVTLSENSCLLLYSKSDKDDEYGYNIFLNSYDKDNLKQTVRIYSNSDLYSFRKFLLTKDSLVIVDYIPVKNTEFVNGKKKSSFTTRFQISRFVLEENKKEFFLVSTTQRDGSVPPARYRDSEAFIDDDPLKQ